MTPDWIVAIWLCIALPGGGEDCTLQIPEGRWPTKFMCDEAAPYAIADEIEAIEARGWTVSRVRNAECRGPSQAV
jgi:hypothetical protein